MGIYLVKLLAGESTLLNRFGCTMCVHVQPAMIKKLVKMITTFESNYHDEALKGECRHI